MPLNEFQRARLRRILLPKENILDSDTGEPVAWDDLGGATDHPSLTGVTANQHHNQDHSHSGSPTQKISQANSHESPDTDSGTGSLHHTIGAGANQAAAGNHSHSGIIINYPALKPVTPTYDFADAALHADFSAHSSQGSFSTANCMTRGADWVGSALEMQFSSQMGVIYVPHADTDFDFEVGGIRHFAMNESAMMLGIAALNSSGSGLAGVVYNDNNCYFADISSWGYNSNSGSWAGHGWNYSSGPWWIRLKRISGTWTLYMSQSGRVWDKVFSTRADSFTIDKLAFGMLHATGSTYTGRLIADYFHVTT